MMIGRWPTLLLLLSVYNTIYTNIFFLSKVLFCFCVCSLFFSLFFFSQFSASHCPFDKLFLNNLFLPLKLPTTRDVNSTKAFLLEVSVMSVPPRSRSLPRKREKEITTFILIYFFATESKSPRIDRLFQPTPAVFAPKKREDISSNHWTRENSRA